MKLTPILILILIIGVVSISGCISIVEPENDTQSINNNQTNPNQNNQTNIHVQNINKSGNIIITTPDNATKTKNKIKDVKNQTTQTPKISKEDIEKEVVRIMKLNEKHLNFTANATLTNKDDGTPYYIVDVYDDYGWFGYFEIDANNGPKGNDKDGYSFDGGAVRGETGDEPTPIDGVMPKLSYNDARKVMDKELENNYSLHDQEYEIKGFLKDNLPYYNITIEEIGEDNTQKTIGTAILDANTGEIISINLKNDDVKKNTTQKVYSVDEAGAYVDITYKGKKVSVRENYPYYSPQNDKIYYSQQEEAEDLIKLVEDMA